MDETTAFVAGYCAIESVFSLRENGGDRAGMAADQRDEIALDSRVLE